MPVCPSLVAYKTPPFCLLQHPPLSKPDHQRKPSQFFPRKPCPAFSKPPPFTARPRRSTMLVFPASFGKWFPKPLVVLLTPITTCSHPSLSLACVDMLLRCSPTLVPTRLQSP